MSTTASGDDVASLRRRLDELAEKASKGDRQSLGDLRQFLDAHPEVENHVGDLVRLTQEAWLDLIAEQNVLIKETARRRIKALRTELLGERPSAAERLLVDQIVICHLNATAANLAGAKGAKTLNQAAYELKRAESAERRLITALRTLALVRARTPQGLWPAGALRVFNPDRKAV